MQQRAAAIVAGMSPGERAGTVVMTAGTVDELPGLAALVARDHLGGVMVRGRSSDGADAVSAAVRAAIGSTGLPPFVATDQEGGEVQVLSGDGFDTIPSAVEQASWSDGRLEAAAERWSGQLRSAGIDLDLAPVADVPCAADRDDNPPVADLDRNYGDDPAGAARSVEAFVDGLAVAGVATTVKHFPGLGCVTANTDTTADVRDTTTDADSASLQSFDGGILAGTPAVMVSSAVYTRIDGSEPALFSSAVIGGLLRQRLGFSGVVVSDDVGGAVALQAWTPAVRATRFVAAGGDLLLDIDPDHADAECAAIAAKAAADPAFADRLTDAATRDVALRMTLKADRAAPGH